MITTPPNCSNCLKSCYFLTSSCNAQYFHTTEHTYARITTRFCLVKFRTVKHRANTKVQEGQSTK